MRRRGGVIVGGGVVIGGGGGGGGGCGGVGGGGGGGCGGVGGDGGGGGDATRLLGLAGNSSPDSCGSAAATRYNKFNSKVPRCTNSQKSHANDTFFQVVRSSQ